MGRATDCGHCQATRRDPEVPAAIMEELARPGGRRQLATVQRYTYANDAVAAEV